MLAKRPLPLADFMANLQTFDIILMQGILATSHEAEQLTNSQWSHVGMVVVAGDLAISGVDPQTRLVWEANTPDNVCDVILNIPKEGPQLTRLTDRMVNNLAVGYDDAFAARKLIFPRTPSIFDTLKTVIDQTHPAGLPVSPDGDHGEGLLMSFLAGRYKNLSIMPGTYFCSQLVAHTYMALGLMSQQYVDSSYAPVDFTSALDVSLLRDAWLGPEILLDADTLPKPTAPTG